MKKIYDIDYSQSMTEDFTYAFVFASDIPEKILGNQRYSAVLRKVHKKLRDKLSRYNDAFGLIVNSDMRYCLITHIKKNHISYSEQLKLKTVDDVINKTVNVPVKELLCRIFACFDNDKNEISFYAGLTANMIAASQYIETMDLSSESKNLLLKTIIDPEGYAQKVLDICFAAKNLLEEIYRENREYIDESFKIFEDEEKVRKTLSDGGLIYINDNLTVVPSFINCAVVYCQSNTDGCRTVLGVDFVNVIQNILKSKMKVDIESMGKLFSDETRCRIINILKKRECYLAQLSHELGIPSNTLHYHIQLLNDDGILLSRSKGRCYYYRLNSAYFEAVKQLADSYINEINEQFQ